MGGHIETDRCGFDRNESHSQDCYVCTCGWSDKDGGMDVSILLRQWASSTLNQDHAAVQFDAADKLDKLTAEVARLQAAVQGEYICRKCGLRQYEGIQDETTF